MKIYKPQPHTNEEGFALIMALIISSVLLSIGMSMLSITLKQVDLTTTTRESELAFQAASAAMECALATRVRQNSSLNTSPPASSIQFRCGFINQTVNRTGSGHTRRYSTEGDWVQGTQSRWVVIDMYVVDASLAERTFQESSRNFTRTCQAGSYCTYIFAQGHNRSQSDIAGGAAFAVQRELTAEF